MNYTEISLKIKKRFVQMVLGSSESDVESQLKLFTNPELRKNATGGKSVHKGGVKRCPHLNHFTGSTSMFMNLEAFQIVLQSDVLSTFAQAYNCDQNDLGMSYGPPTVLIKPEASGVSPAFVYKFGDNDEIRFTGLMSLSKHKNDAMAAGVQKMVGFEHYYDILSHMYDFSQHCQDGSILYLEKWFSMEASNRFLEEYTAYYNFVKSNVPITLTRKIPHQVIQLYETHQFQVPEIFNPLHWVDVSMPVGQLRVFSSREAIRTLPGKDKETSRLYLQIPIQKLSKSWDHSEFRRELEQSYKSGRFGDWHKPGKRCYVRENKSEYQALQQSEIENVWSYVQQHKSIFAL